MIPAATERFRRWSMGMGSGTALCLALLGTMPLAAQQSSSNANNASPPPAQGDQKTQQPSAAGHKSAAQENPFPSDVSGQAAQQPQQGDAAPTPSAAPDAPQSGDGSSQAKKPGQAAQENPFPEDVSKGAAAKAANSNGASGAPGYSSSSANPGSSGDADPNADIPTDTGRRKLRKPSDKDIQSGSLTGQGRAKDDVKIGRFYLGDGNYRGAHGRFSEAARFDPSNVEAIYGVAASAQGMHQADEALTNYKLYLQIAPDGEHAKAAEKAIQQLSK